MIINDEPVYCSCVTNVMINETVMQLNNITLNFSPTHKTLIGSAVPSADL